MGSRGSSSRGSLETLLGFFWIYLHDILTRHILNIYYK